MNTYRIVFRWSSVTRDRDIQAKNIVKAAKKAEEIAVEMQAEDSFGDAWSVYSITLV